MLVLFVILTVITFISYQHKLYLNKCSRVSTFYQDIPEETDLSYLDRGRLEEEYRKLKELKKKAENYAVEAKQTAQRVCLFFYDV